MTPWLTDPEIDDLCAGLVQSAAKVRYLQGLGLTVKLKPNGRPIVNRAHFDEVMAGLPPGRRKRAAPVRVAPQPDVAGLVLAFTRGRAAGA